MARRSYGSGSLQIRADRNGCETWYGTWWAPGGTRVKRRVGPKRATGRPEGLTRTQGEAQLRKLIATEVVIAGPSRRTVTEAGEAYIEHLEHVMERKLSTVADYRGYLGKHLGPFFGGTPMDKVDRAKVESYLLTKKHAGYAAKTIQNHLNFLHGIWALAIKREWATRNPVALVDRPRAPRDAHRRIQPRGPRRGRPRRPRRRARRVERPRYLCAAMTGLRQGELVALRWIDVDWTASRVRVAESFTRGHFDTPKNHRGRSVPLSDRMAGSPTGSGR